MLLEDKIVNLEFSQNMTAKGRFLPLSIADPECPLS